MDWRGEQALFARFIDGALTLLPTIIAATMIRGVWLSRGRPRLSVFAEPVEPDP